MSFWRQPGRGLILPLGLCRLQPGHLRFRFRRQSRLRFGALRPQVARCVLLVANHGHDFVQPVGRQCFQQANQLRLVYQTFLLLPNRALNEDNGQVEHRMPLLVEMLTHGRILTAVYVIDVLRASCANLSPSGADILHTTLQTLHHVVDVGAVASDVIGDGVRAARCFTCDDVGFHDVLAEWTVVFVAFERARHENEAVLVIRWSVFVAAVSALGC